MVLTSWAKTDFTAEYNLQSYFGSGGRVCRTGLRFEASRFCRPMTIDIPCAMLRFWGNVIHPLAADLLWLERVHALMRRSEQMGILNPT